MTTLLDEISKDGVEVYKIIRQAFSASLDQGEEEEPAEEGESKNTMR